MKYLRQQSGLWFPDKKLHTREKFLPGFAPGAVSMSKGGPTIQGSIIFNGSNEYLEITNFSSSSPNQRQFTISFWTKIDDLANSEFPTFFSTGSLLGGFFEVYWIAVDETLKVEGSGWEADTLDDPGVLTNGTWYHICVTVDTEASAGNAVNIYVNGVAFDANESTGDPDTVLFENGEDISIGYSTAFFGDHIDGRIADFIVVEGQVLGPDNFGFDDGGTWKWKDYTGAFGNHGFRINPQDSSEIGTDQSGNGYDFTLNNMDSSNFDSADIPPT